VVRLRYEPRAPLSVTAPRSLITRLDELVAALREEQPALPVSRSQVVVKLLEQQLDQLQDEGAIRVVRHRERPSAGQLDRF
jgi:hypothetical protein